jgi:uncharacterized radical SAM superfamily Fe-S cluster-containing enzyme
MLTKNEACCQPATATSGEKLSAYRSDEELSQAIAPDAVIQRTESLCPVCFKVLPAEIVRSGDEILMCRRCPEHGNFQEPIWRGQPDFETWRRPKNPAVGLKVHRESEKGCPFDCGLCPEHAQYPCTILLEITQRCDLVCPVCFASSGDSCSKDQEIDKIIERLPFIKQQAREVVLQISGGEPTMHDGLLDLVYEASRLFPAVQLNTNGLRLAREPEFASRLLKNGLSWVFLQFDSLNEDNLRVLRGRAILKEKLKAVENLEKANLPTVLVPTIVKGLNDQELGDLIKFGVTKPLVRGLHFQPMTTSGRNDFQGSENRLTLPEHLQELGRQTKGLVDISQAFPPGCEHERCSFHLRFRRQADGTLLPRPGASEQCCSGRPPKTTITPSEARETADSRNRAVDIILRSWSPGKSQGQNQEKVPDKQPLMLPMAKKAPDAFDEFISQAAKASFSLTAMAFQDVWTVDLARLRGCCVHVFNYPDRFVPFCAMNLTSATGEPLYRK